MNLLHTSTYKGLTYQVHSYTDQLVKVKMYTQEGKDQVGIECCIMAEHYYNQAVFKEVLKQLHNNVILVYAYSVNVMELYE